MEVGYMLKRILMVILVSCFLPVMAHAATWSLTSSAKTAGGTIQVGTGPTRTYLQGNLVTPITTGSSVDVTVAASAGYEVSKVVINTTTYTNPTQTVWNFPATTTTAQSIAVSFAIKKLTVTSSVAGNVGGTVTPTLITGITPNAALTVAKVVTFTPASAAFTLSGITGIPTVTAPAIAAIQSPAVPAAGQVVTVTFPVGFKFTSNVILTGTFTSIAPVANAGSPQNAYAGNIVTLNGTGSNLNGVATTYAWAQTSGPAVTITNPTAATATFVPPTAGTYIFSLTLMPGGSTASTTVTVSASADQKVVADCQNCHAANSIVRAVAAYNKWTTSKHQSVGIICADCHKGNHPGTVSLTVCNDCHHKTADADLHNGATTFNSSCMVCHDKHQAQAVPPGLPHFNNMTAAGTPDSYPASYVTSKATCNDCHNSAATNQAIRKQWKATGHADINSPAWMGGDFKTQNDCARCHTTTGFIAYSSAKVTAAWGVSTDKSKEVLRCNGCHSDVGNGVVRSVTPNNPFTSEPLFTNQNLGASNVCMNCHGGTDNGNFIQAQVGTTVFSSTPFQYNAHGMTAGGSLQGKTGFNFIGRTYTDFAGNAHSKVSMANSMGTGSAGPCAGCHMSAPDKHTFKAISSANGAIAAITTNICSNCHSTSLPATTLDTKRLEFNNALEVLRIQLGVKEFTWNAAAATFYAGSTTNPATNWGAGQAGANIMGAAHNYKLFITESGAYAHNPAYAKQLITDSIDAAANNGVVTGSIVSALNALRSGGKITDAQYFSFNTYTTSNSCNSCHGNPPVITSTGATHTTNTNCSACHIYTGPGGSTHSNGTLDISMTCSSCHGNPPTTQTIHTTGAAKYNHNISKPALNHTDCTQCHSTPPTYAVTTTHRNNTVDLFTNATACSSCHGYPPATIAASGAAHVNDTNCANCHEYTTYTASTHNSGTVDFKTGTAACSSCHGYPPASQTIHANGAVKYNHDKVAVNYTDCTQCHATPSAPTVTSTHLNGTVDLLTNVSACNSCHVAPPASGAHATATLSPLNCTNCHTYTVSSAAPHNNGSVDFTGSLTCDTCHGYPPMSAGQLTARGANEYVNGRVEDYTNGGGHHATHLPSSLTAAEGFAPCLPCHPSVDLNLATHGQGGGSVQRANINVFYAADNGYVFDDARTKRYNTVAMSCSNISCHFQPTLSW